MALTQSKIPPQAYTRDTLVKAIEWLSGQPVSVRERANSADLIVSHYLQARRHSAAAQMEAPLSQESFKADLRHLAEDLKRFDEPSAPPPQPTRSPSYIDLKELRSESVTRHESTIRSMSASPSQQAAPPQVHQTTLPHQASVSHQTSAPQAVSEPVVKGPVWAIDTRSLVLARELQDRLNLSSEGEAIRMLITMGAERARSVFPSS